MGFYIGNNFKYILEDIGVDNNTQIDQTASLGDLFFVVEPGYHFIIVFSAKCIHLTIIYTS